MYRFGVRLLILPIAGLVACQPSDGGPYDIVIEHGRIVDGTGAAWFNGDRPTFADPHQLSVGVREVFVNGVGVVRDGRHTGAKPGRIMRGPGYRGTD